MKRRAAGKKEKATDKKEKVIAKKTAEKQEKQQPKKFHRSTTDRVIGGVCGGIAQYFKLDSILVRLVFVLFIFSVDNGFWLYLILWLVVPSGARAEVEEVKKATPARKQRSLTTAIVLVLIGLIFLFNNFEILPWGIWGFVWKLWPIFLILAGLEIFVGVNLLGQFLLIILAVIISLFIVGFLFSLTNRNFKESLQKRLPFWKPDKWEQWFKLKEKPRQPKIEFDFLEDIFPPDQV